MAGKYLIVREFHSPKMVDYYSPVPVPGTGREEFNWDSAINKARKYESLGQVVMAFKEIETHGFWYRNSDWSILPSNSTPEEELVALADLTDRSTNPARRDYVDIPDPGTDDLDVVHYNGFTVRILAIEGKLECCLSWSY